MLADVQQGVCVSNSLLYKASTQFARYWVPEKAIPGVNRNVIGSNGLTPLGPCENFDAEHTIESVVQIFSFALKRQFSPSMRWLHSGDRFTDIIDRTSILNFFAISFNKLQICGERRRERERPTTAELPFVVCFAKEELTLKWNDETEVDFPQLDDAKCARKL